MDIQQLRQMSLFTFQRSRSKFKVKTAILKIFHIQQLGCGLRYLHQIWQPDRSNFWTKCTFRQNSRRRPDGSCTLWVCYYFHITITKILTSQLLLSTQTNYQWYLIYCHESHGSVAASLIYLHNKRRYVCLFICLSVCCRWPAERLGRSRLNLA